MGATFQMNMILIDLRDAFQTGLSGSEDSVERSPSDLISWRRV